MAHLENIVNQILYNIMEDLIRCVVHAIVLVKRKATRSSAAQLQQRLPIHRLQSSSTLVSFTTDRGSKPARPG
jgi:hypothetical protein